MKVVERLIKNEQTLKRWRRFKSLKRSIFAAWFALFLVFMSLTAEMWANSMPIILSFQGTTFFPVYKDYHPSEFGQEGFVTDYRAIKLGESDWAIWPLVKWDPLEANKELQTYPGPPSADNYFGTDDRGRDVLSRLIYGFRYSFGFATAVWVFAYTIGILIGSLMGFSGGLVDLIGQRFVEIFESLPWLLILITLVSVFGASIGLLIVLSSLLGWMQISIYMRAEYLKLRKRDFVEAARSLGGSKPRQIFKHILPNALGPIITFSPFTIASLISALAILDYLGFGLPPPTPSWGELLQQAQKYFTIAWWLAVFPSLALFASLLTMNLIGEGVRDAFDPRKSV